MNKQSSSRSSRERAAQWVWLSVTVGALLLSALIGFRLPSLYAVTLYNVSLFDGAWRRGVFASLLEPAWQATNYAYSAMAAVAIAILLCVLIVVLRASWTARNDTQRLLIVAWVASPLGAYFFHQVGYQDQLVYLMFFGAVLAVLKSRIVSASIIMSASVFIHEMTIVTTFPLWILVMLLHSVPLRRLWLAIPPAAVAVLLLFLPNMSDEQVKATGLRLRASLPFEFRWDAIALFGRSLNEVWSLDWYSPLEGLRTVAPLAALSLASMFALATALSRRQGSLPNIIYRRLQVLFSCLAVLGPFSLVAVGWDFYRWAFLGVTNFVLVAYFWMSKIPDAPKVGAIGLMLVPILALFYFPLQYFDGFAPRPLTFDLLQRVVSSPADVLLEVPNDTFQWSPESGIDPNWLVVLPKQ